MQNRPHSQHCRKFRNIHWQIKYHRLIRSVSLLFKKLQFYLSWPIQFSTKFSWLHAPASDCVNGTRPQCFTLTSGSFHTEDIVLQNIMCLRFIWLDMLHIAIKKSNLSSKLISRSKTLTSELASWIFLRNYLGILRVGSNCSQVWHLDASWFHLKQLNECLKL